MEKMKVEIVPAKLAIKAMMDSGYKNAAYALAELMDNSIQAGASQVELLCIERSSLVDTRKRSRIEEIAILDNGCGMTDSTLRQALQFGNGTRLDEENQKGMGKFGMGLPSASISQAKKVEVWSWTNGVESAKYSYLDVSEIISGELDEIPAAISKELPKKWIKIGKSFGKSGTLVVWSGLERCIWKTGDAIINNSEFLIGRMYRKFLHGGAVNIRMATFDGDSAEYKIKGEEKTAKPNDPLYLMEKSSAPAPFDKTPMFEPFPTQESFETKVDVKYHGATYPVFIRSAIAKKEVRGVAESGQVAGNATHGSHATKNIGLSILRAGRELELDSSWASFGNPMEKWWGLEIEFPPALDELFGVTNNKQYASHFAEMSKIDINDWLKESGLTYQQLKDDLSLDDDPKKPLIEISHEIRRLISQMRTVVKAQNKNSDRRNGRSRHGLTAEIEATAKTRALQGEGHIGASDSDESKPKDERRNEIQNALEEKGLTPRDAKEFAGAAIDKSLKYLFLESDLDSAAFFSVQAKGGALMITLNINHPAYDRLVEVLEKETSDQDDVETLRDRLNNALDGLKLLLMAWARYEDEQQSKQARDQARNLRDDWGRMASRFLEVE